MKTKALSLCLLLTLLVRVLPAAEEPIDFDKARQISERSQRAETLTPAEEAYINRAKAEHQRQQAAGNPAPAASAAGAGDIDREKARGIQERRHNGEKLSAEDTVYLKRAKAAHAATAPAQPKWTEHLTPLTELGTAKSVLSDSRTAPPTSPRSHRLSLFSGRSIRACALWDGARRWAEKRRFPILTGNGTGRSPKSPASTASRNTAGLNLGARHCAAVAAEK